MRVGSDAETTATGAGKTAYAPLIRLSSGGMGYVELCVRREGKFQRLYAVKRLLPAVRHDEEAIGMFVEEGRVGGLVQHPNVVSVLDVGTDDRGPYLVMEYVSGVTVRELVSAAAKATELLPVQLVCRVAGQVARGLAAAHDLRSHEGDVLALVHRDVSPHNLLVGYDGVVQVADFGIARVLGRDHRTATGLLKGKLGYMSPEVLRFEKVTPASDLFSFGIVLWEMLSSRRLYGHGDDAKRARRILDEPAPPLDDIRDDVPEELAGLLDRLLAKALDERPGSAREVADRLETVANALAAEEGKTDLVSHLEETFAEKRKDREVELQVALDALRAQPEPGTLEPEALEPEEEEETATRPAWWLWAAGVLLLLLAAAGGGWAATASSGPEEVRLPAPPADPVAVEAPPTPEPVEAQFVTLRLRSEPSGATVQGEAFEEATTPTELRLAQSETPVYIRFALEGHEPVEEQVTPDVDQLLRVQLSPIAAEPDRPASRRGRRRPPPSKAPPSRGFGLFSD
ncbi:MAG: serine/threonine-protein kinase [Sandaracinaceae bacterium]